MNRSLLVCFYLATALTLTGLVAGDARPFVVGLALMLANHQLLSDRDAQAAAPAPVGPIAEYDRRWPA